MYKCKGCEHLYTLEEIKKKYTEIEGDIKHF